MSRNGSVTAVTLRISAHHGRSRTSRHAREACPVARSTTYRTIEASRQRKETIIAAENPSSAYLINRYEPPQMAARAASSVTWRADMDAVQCRRAQTQAQMKIRGGPDQNRLCIGLRSRGGLRVRRLRRAVGLLVGLLRVVLVGTGVGRGGGLTVALGGAVV